MHVPIDRVRARWSACSDFENDRCCLDDVIFKFFIVVLSLIGNFCVSFEAKKSLIC